MTDREILERLLVSLTCCENEGDIVEVIERTANLAGIPLPQHDELGDLGEAWGAKPGVWQ